MITLQMSMTFTKKTKKINKININKKKSYSHES
jgi:hypothetical protein